MCLSAGSSVSPPATLKHEPASHLALLPQAVCLNPSSAAFNGNTEAGPSDKTSAIGIDRPAGGRVLTYVRMTRSRLYVLIDAFENDMRQILLRYVLDHLPEQEALGGNFEKADLRRSNDEVGADVSVVQYLDLQEAYDILNRHRNVLPSDLGRELRDNTPLLRELVSVRNRVMHGRPLATGDAESAISVCESFRSRYWPETLETLRHLHSDPTWEPAFKQQANIADLVLHNLPLPEYDDTGLIGRSSDCQEILNRLMRRRDPIITIIGEGGIGKTAVAVDVAYRVLDDPSSPYDCILWVSLKTERLTAGGVVDIADAIRDVTGAAQRLGQTLDDDFRGSVKDLAEMLEGIETLLIIDNLETVNASEIVNLYDTLPDTVTYLFTSRVGIGQFERRIPIQPLRGKDADILFRNFAKARGVDRLAKLSAATVSEVVKRLRNSPLAIRWYILSVEAGQQPNLALADQDALLDFCVRSVYEAVKPEAQVILAAIFALDRDVTFGELAILSELPADDLRTSVHDLLRGSMVSVSADSEDPLVTRIVLTEAARQFLRRVRTPSISTVEHILERERDYRKSDELRRSDESRRQLAPNVVRTRNANDRPTAHLLRRALLASRESTLSQALDLVSRARDLNPDFWEVDRVEAFILSSAGQVEQASAVYRSALHKADEEGVAVVSYFYAGHLGRKANDPERAIEFARTAHNYFNSSDTAQLLGNFLIWLNRFEDGQAYIERAFEEGVGKSKLIALTSLIDSWRRWAEYTLHEDRRPMEAAHKALAGFSLGAKEIRSGTRDIKLGGAVLESISIFFRAVTSRGVDASAFTPEVIRMLEFALKHSSLLERARGWHHFPGHVGKLLRSNPVDPRVRDICERMASKISLPMPSEEALGNARRGVVSSWRGTFGFISSESLPLAVFFPASAIEGLTMRGEEIELNGKDVNFTAETTADGRLRANWVQIA